MKKIGKISINTDRLIKNDELINLRGGYDTNCYGGTELLTCVCTNGTEFEGCYSPTHPATIDAVLYCGSADNLDYCY